MTSTSTVSTTKNLQHEAAGTKGAVAVLQIRLSGEGVEFERLDDIAAALLAWHIGDCAEIARKDAGRYAAHFRTLSEERAAIKLQGLAEAVPVRFQEEFGEQVRADITYVAGPPLRAEKGITVPEYVDTLLDQLEAKELIETAKWEGKVRTARREAALAFTPVWNSVTETTDLCHCVLDLSLRSGLIQQISDEAPGDELREIHAALDVMALRKTLLTIHKGAAQRNWPDMVVPVSAHTIGNYESWNAVVEHIREAPETVRTHLILELSEDGTDKSLVEKIAQLAALKVRSIARTQWLGTISAEIAQARPWGLAVDLAMVKRASPDQWRWLAGMANFASYISAKTFALNIRTAAVGQKTLDANFNHLAGSAIHGPAPHPRVSSRLRPFQLHKRKKAA